MRSVALGGVAAVLAVGSGCIRYTPYCENGVSPFDGQSAVPLDGGVTFTVKGPLADDLPPLDDAITFETRSGRRVPFHVEVRPDAGEVRVIPDHPLEADTTYVVTGVDWHALRDSLHWWGELPESPNATTTTFSTTHQPHALGTYGFGDTTFVLAFSEAVDADSVTGRVRFTQDRTGATDFEVLGHWEDQPNLVWLAAKGELPALRGRELTLSFGIQSPDGVQLAGVETVGWAMAADRSAELDRFRGEPVCGVSF